MSKHRRKQRQPINADQTDQGNAERFANEHRDVARYCPETSSWYVWNGKRWCPDRMIRVMELAKQTADNIFEDAKQASAAGDTALAHALSRHAVQSRQRARMKAMVHHAADTAADLKVAAGDLDAAPSRLNVQNGTVNIRDLTLLPHTPNDLLTKIAGASFQKNTVSPTWETFLDSTFQGDRDLIRWVQRAIGYSLTGDTKEQCFFICYGTGSNGKTTFLETILDVLGDYGRATQFEAFLADASQGVRAMEQIGHLRGIRYAIASETRDSKRFNEAILKRVTGEDTLTGAKLHRGSYTFRPQFKLWLAVNHLPTVKDASYGFWRRCHVLPFLKQFKGEEMDSDLSRTLRQEQDGILTWCLRGAQAYLLHGLGTCEAVQHARDAYREEQDHVTRFMTECTKQAYGSEIQARELFDTFTEWCRFEDVPSSSKHMFSRQLAERDYAKRRANSGVIYMDLALDTAEFSRRRLAELKVADQVAAAHTGDF